MTEKAEREEFRDRIGFALGTGRCGTKFISEVVALEPQVASCHERNNLNETFHRYCQWYQLPVDHSGFLAEKEREIQGDLRDHSFSFEASAFLSLSVLPLHERFGSKFLLMIRSPEKVANSYLEKGWYDQEIFYEDTNQAVGYQGFKRFHHFLGRTVPKGDFYHEKWKNFGRVGKLAWYWATINSEVIRQFDQIPPTHRRTEKLEGFDFQTYRNTCEFLGFSSEISETKFRAVADRKPNAFRKKPSVLEWSEQDKLDFESQVGDLAERFGYEWRVDVLKEKQRDRDSNNSGSSAGLLKKIKGIFG
jgi:hypothetical protein